MIKTQNFEKLMVKKEVDWLLKLRMKKVCANLIIVLIITIQQITILCSIIKMYVF